jgi:hypothetical protein
MPIATGNRTTLRALWMGAALPPGRRRLSVHSVFTRALNLSIEGWDLLATVTGPEGEGMPHSIALGLDVDFSGLELRPGDRGSLDEASLCLRAGGGPIEIELSDSERETVGGPAGIDGLARAARGSAFGAAAEALAEEEELRCCDLRIGALLRGEPCLGAMGRRLVEAALALATSLRQPAAGSSREALGSAVRRLVGLGPGLTPSGDDFLCGLLASSSFSRHQLAEALEEAALAGIAGTNEISASLLRCAARGLFPRDLRRAAAALAAEDEVGAVLAIRRLCAHGHSSGADTAAGFLFGLAALTSASTLLQ